MPQTRAQKRKKQNDKDSPPATLIKQPTWSPDNTLSPLQYQHIDLRGHQIRTLYLLPGNHDDPVRCVLRMAFLDESPKYEALSYVWGDNLDFHSIEVDGRQKDVTVNLYNALRRLRYPRRRRCLWVDALCIDQDNDTEKSHQVNLMSKIYSRTKRAILWLGDFSDDPNLSTNQIARDTAIAAFNLIKRMATNQHYGLVNDSSNEQLGDTGLTALSCLLQLPWWHRAWTVQEAVLPADASIVCGSQQLPFSRFLEAFRNSIQHHYADCCNDQDLLDPFWDQLQALIHTQESFRQNTLHIEDAINVFRCRQASDPRDKVYAYLGLSSGISANYTLSYEEVFRLSTLALIRDSGTLRSLLRTLEAKRSPTLPTWVPDWCAEIQNSQYDSELGWLFTYPYYRASGRAKAVFINSCSDNVLHLKGFLLDRISQLGDILDNASSMEQMIARWQDSSGDKYPRGGTYSEASWRTIAGDLFTETSDYRRLESGSEAKRMVTDKLEDDYGSLVAFNQKGFFTETGMIGLGNRDVQVGDSIYILAGGAMPFILRQAERNTDDIAYQYIGQAYIHGVMDGEMMEKGLDFEWISLV